jgi:hypothetical protein
MLLQNNLYYIVNDSTSDFTLPSGVLFASIKDFFE